MKPETLFLPVCAQAMLTLAVWLWMYYTRLTTLSKSGADPQELENEVRAQEILKGVVHPSDNFENLFELPVLFFAGVFVVHATGLSDSLYLNLVWAFVGFRALHSLIHCSYNKIVHRFAAYLFSSIALWAIWIRLAVQLLGTNG